MGRPWAERIKSHLGTIVIENIGGAGGGVGAAQAVRSRPDGYTLLLGSDSLFGINPHLYPRMPIDPHKELVPVATLVANQLVLAVNPAVMKNLRFDVQLNGEEQGKFNDDLTAMANDPTKSNIAMYISVWGADYPDPQNFLSQQLRTDVGNNNGHWSDPDFDKLVDQADIERDQAKRMTLYNQAEQIAIDKVGWLPLYNGKGTILIRPNVKGLVYTAQGLVADDWSQVSVK